MTLPELLAPAGSFAALHAAVSAGADAVYLGMGAFNARRNAENFDAGNIAKACDYAHLRGVKVYIAMNTIILPDEMEAALDCAACAHEAGADAFIVQDIGLMAALQRAIPNVRIHASTQMNIHSESGIRAAAEMGAVRVTLARELSLGEISHLVEAADALGLQVEAFAHGALCVCYSGQCLMSSMIGGRSANRGLCAQACRLNYDLVREGGRRLEAPGEYLLSPKDLCSIDMLEQLTSAGIASLKIEGRMKSPEYVSSVVSVYREVLDRIGCSEAYGDDASASPTDDERSRLASAFSRGFTTAYLEGQRGNEIMSYQRPNNRGQFVGRVKWVRNGRAGIACERQLMPGDVVEIWTKRGRTALTIGDSAECTASFAEVPLDDKAKVYASDRVFRVRSSEVAFKDAEDQPRIPIVGFVSLKLGEPLRATFRIARPDGLECHIASDLSAAHILDRLWESASCEDAVTGTAEGCIVESARSKEISSEDVEAHIGRLGSTPFRLERLEICLDEGVGMGFSQLHHIRAEALERLQENLLAPYRLCNVGTLPATNEPIAEPRGAVSERLRRSPHRAQCSKDGHAADIAEAEIVALATNPECAHAAKRAGAARIYVPALNYRRGMSEIQGRAIFNAGQAAYPKRCTIIMPVADHDAKGASREAESEISAWDNIAADSTLLVQGIGDMQKAVDLSMPFEIGSHIPIVNHCSAEVAGAFGAQRVWLSPELNLRQIGDLAMHCGVPLGIKLFGAQELMTTEHCMLASQGACNEDCAKCARRTRLHYLKDRKGYEFPVMTDALGRGHIYNSVKLDATPELEQMIGAGVKCFMVDTTLMSAEESAQAVGYCVSALHALEDEHFPGADSERKDSGRKRMSGSTSGHLHRGVL